MKAMPAEKAAAMLELHRLGYLSGAPRLSTRPDSAATGSRSRTLGIMGGFRAAGWEVNPYIAGDGLATRWMVGQKGEEALLSSWLARLAADMLRIIFAVFGCLAARRKIGRVDWVFEYFGAFQAIGWPFQRRGVPWILGTDALLHVESTHDRSTVALAGLLKLAERWAYRRCDVLVCVSRPLADMVIREMGIEREKVVVVPNAVNADMFDPGKASPRRLFTSDTIGFVGHLYPWQRLDLLIEAVAELSAEGLTYELVIIGDGPMRSAWQSLAHSLGLADHIRFTGPVAWEEVPSYIIGFDLAYMGQVPLSVGEMYLSPLKLYEYAAMARPVVASAFDDAGQLIVEGSTGYLFEAGSKQDLKRALRLAHSGRNQWAAMGARLRSAVLDQHSWTARIRQMIGEIEAIVQEKYGAPYPGRRQA
jgi:glycosyltransferase involved in cell wall biosynthesis